MLIVLAFVPACDTGRVPVGEDDVDAGLDSASEAPEGATTADSSAPTADDGDAGEAGGTPPPGDDEPDEGDDGNEPNDGDDGKDAGDDPSGTSGGHEGASSGSSDSGDDASDADSASPDTGDSDDSDGPGAGEPCNPLSSQCDPGLRCSARVDPAETRACTDGSGSPVPADGSCNEDEECGPQESCMLVLSTFECDELVDNRRQPGDACTAQRDCDIGAWCNTAATPSVCTQLCSSSGRGPACDGANEVCIPWFEGTAPAPWEDVGTCVRP